MILFSERMAGLLQNRIRGNKKGNDFGTAKRNAKIVFGENRPIAKRIDVIIGQGKSSITLLVCLQNLRRWCDCVWLTI